MRLRKSLDFVLLGSVATNAVGKCPNVLSELSSGFTITNVETSPENIGLSLVLSSAHHLHLWM